MSTSTTCIHSGSFRLLPLLSVVGSTHHSAFFDVNLNSSMMFSSLFAVVQSSAPRCPQCLAWATLTSQSCLQFPLLTLLFTQPSSVPFQCRAWSLGTSSGCALNPSAPSYFLTPPCDSHLNRHVLAATSIILGQSLSHITWCISATLSEELAFSTLLSFSTPKRLELSSLPGSLVAFTSFFLVFHLAVL